MKDENAAVRTGNAGHFWTRASHTPPLLLRVSAFALVAFVVLGVGWWGVLRHERREALRQQQIVSSLGVLKRTFSGRVFSACAADGSPAALRANFHNASVRSVTLSRADGGMTAAVEILGTQTVQQSPTIYVTLYDKNGTTLSRSAVVKYLFDTLTKGDLETVTDTMTLPSGAEPAVVSVDDPDQDKRPNTFE